jgi:hemerythrin superfamily protein
MPRPSPQKRSASGSSSEKTRNKRPAQKEPDALEILKADHETIMSLFRKHTAASPEDQPSLAKQIFTELELHTAVEEELFYPALREKGELKDLAEVDADDTDARDAEEVPVDLSTAADEEEEDTIDLDEELEEEGEDLITLAYEDHKAVKDLIQELKQLAAGSEQYRDRFLELKEAVTDHVGEEEEMLFPEARLNVDTKKLGADLVKRRNDLASSMAA